MNLKSVIIPKVTSAIILTALVGYTGFLVFFASKSTEVFGCYGGQADLFPKDSGRSCARTMFLETSEGNLEIEFLQGFATTTAENFIKLAESGFYDDTKFHRVIKNFMVQGGDPLSRGDDRSVYGTGGPGYAFNDEINDTRMVRGIVAMANSGPDTNGSQFFIITAPQTPWLQGAHTVFAKVIKGMDVADRISRSATDKDDVPITPIVVKRAYLKK